jgi:hypothetical protein
MRRRDGKLALQVIGGDGPPMRAVGRHPKHGAALGDDARLAHQALDAFRADPDPVVP